MSWTIYLKKRASCYCHSPSELVYVSSAFMGGRLPEGTSVGVMTVSGGNGVIIADEATILGFQLPSPSARVEALIRERIPPYGLAKPHRLHRRTWSMIRRTLTRYSRRSWGERNSCDSHCGYVTRYGRANDRSNISDV